jgi:hypothetical protein
MPNWKYSRVGQSVLAALLGSVGSIAIAQAQVAGTVGSVNNAARGTPPGGSERSLSVGAAVMQKERVQTDPSGTAHIMFKDRSALNIGRNSSVVINKFVYEPGSGAGQQSLTLARGAARFVGGQVSHSTETTIGTPAASIGVRGGNITAVLETNGHVVVMVHNGVGVVTNNFGSVTVHTGYQLIAVPGAPLGTPTRISLEYLRAATRRLASTGQQTGGASNLPTETEAAQYGVGSSQAAAPAPSFDLPNAGDDLTHGATTSKGITPIIPRPPDRIIYRP